MLKGQRGKRRKEGVLREHVHACPLYKPVLATLSRQFAEYLKRECQANLSRRGIYTAEAGVIGQVTIRMIYKALQWDCDFDQAQG